MNLFRLVADLMHLASIGILLLKMLKSKSCSGALSRSAFAAHGHGQASASRRSYSTPSSL
jgi:hypothetical protein